MRHMLRAGIAFSLAVAAAGCMAEDTLRIQGVTPGAGDAIAGNTAMQMVDPWPVGVQQTRLRVPATRPQQPSFWGEPSGSLSNGAATSDQ